MEHLQNLGKYHTHTCGASYTVKEIKLSDTIIKVNTIYLSFRKN
jgi:hypothetical protein